MNKCQFMTQTIKRMAHVGGEGGGLPAAYQQVEYLQNNNKAFIFTNLEANSIDWENDCFYFESEALVFENNQGALFGACLANAEGTSFKVSVGAELSHLVDGDYWPWVTYTRGGSWPVRGDKGINVPLDTWLSVSGYLKYGDQRIDIENIGGVQATSKSPPDFSTIYLSGESSPYIYLFIQASTKIQTGTGFSVPKNVVNNRFHGKMKSMKFWTDNQGLLRDYIPCYRKSDNKAGMYDLVTKQFHYSNSSTSEAYQFIVGPDV